MLSRLLDDEALMRDVLEAGFEDLDRNLREFRAGLQANRVADAMLRIHSIKGVALNAGFGSLGNFAGRVEDELEANNLDRVAELLPELETLMQGSLLSAKRYLAPAS